MIKFILNDVEIKTDLKPGMLLLDLIRYNQQLTGTKIGCREGDCGACTVLVGEIKNGHLEYSTATSCLMAIGNACGKHIVTIEGINIDGLNAIQEAFAKEGATQCGFCTPGFIVSLAGFSLDKSTPTYERSIDAMNGNICRCTGYKSIERAAKNFTEILGQRSTQEPVEFAVDNRIIPAYFLKIKERLLKLNGQDTQSATAGNKFLGGGTDLYVQQHDTMPGEAIGFLFDKTELKGINQYDDVCEIGGAATVADIAVSPVFQKYFPALKEYIELVSSTQIRNMATVAGNFTNASPIGDLTIIFLALDAKLTLNDGAQKRTISLRSFYKGYKQLDKKADEFIEKISFVLPAETDRFNFEKVSKRTHLDIASVNSAIKISMEGNVVSSASISAGGVGPIPAWLSNGSAFLTGKEITPENIEELLKIVQSEISPISDARGSEAYKRLLLSQLIKAHFIKSFPALPIQNLLHG
ncbi:FAD binding domain-containing protein [Ferruginibacter sp. HRS2-29]|uniref:FAD binding domain-containing protein n=1 Tax=Ferruginibacter sp. HRS2-29 TaxID=2487334 RepID=UPI0020CCBCC7|nr:FAD binding domain-containing protein [Ferruginibacter sp. HRS2-29]MCP9750743.1 (2Fe-2S)-binding protein [Ferruginibacter sp. HRS2-29]